MSTRAVYTFNDNLGDTFAVYKHYDGYPSGACEFIQKAKAFAWSEGRFEASDFAAAFVAANKNAGGGDVRFSKGADHHGDLDYDYVITPGENDIVVEAFVHEWDEATGEETRRSIFKGDLAAFEYAATDEALAA